LVREVCQSDAAGDTLGLAIQLWTS
jgi:hypothetical protein